MIEISVNGNIFLPNTIANVITKEQLESYKSNVELFLQSCNFYDVFIDAIQDDIGIGYTYSFMYSQHDNSIIHIESNVNQYLDMLEKLFSLLGILGVEISIENMDVVSIGDDNNITIKL